MWHRLILQSKKSGPLLGIVGALVGFVGDILQPLAPLSGYLFFAAAFASITILIAMVVRASLPTSVVAAFILSLTMMVSSGLLYIVQGEEDIDTGVLANAIPVIKSLQSSLGLIAEDLTEIKETTARTEEAVQKIAENTQETTEATKEIADAVQDSTQRIVGSLAEIQEEFSALTQSGGIIPNPTRPEQFYHNARVYELGGDYGNARRSYNRYFTFKLDFLDPHLRYQTFLKIQEGRAGAREIYSAIYENDPRPIVEFARILLFDAPKRTEMLQEFIARNPDFALAYYELSREFSEDRKGSQTLTDKRTELKALQEFSTLKDHGKFIKYFVDKELSAEWIADVEKRLKALSLIADMKNASPVSISAITGNTGWRVRAEIFEPEGVREVFYKLPQMSEFKSMGLLRYMDPRTGLPMPNQEFDLGTVVSDTIIEFKYIDLDKKERGPFKVLFKEEEQILKFCTDLYNQIGLGTDRSTGVLQYPGCEDFKVP